MNHFVPTSKDIPPREKGKKKANVTYEGLLVGKVAWFGVLVTSKKGQKETKNM